MDDRIQRRVISSWYKRAKGGVNVVIRIMTARLLLPVESVTEMTMELHLLSHLRNRLKPKLQIQRKPNLQRKR